MFDAFEDNRPGVSDRIENAPPFGPIDRAVAWREVPGQYLPAVIVVDVGGRQK